MTDNIKGEGEVQGITRRDLLKTGAVLAAGTTAMAALGACSPSSATASTVNFEAAAKGVTDVTWEAAVAGPFLETDVTRPSVNISSPMVFKQCLTGLRESLVTQIITPMLPGAERDAKYPLVIYVASGGFSKSEPFSADLNMRCEIAKTGYIVATICHRVGIASGQWPLPLEDLKAGVRWLKAHADDFNIDKEHVGVIGASAGGYFASMLGVTGGVSDFDTEEHLDQDSSVQAVVDFYGPSDLTIIGAGLDDAFPEERNEQGLGYESNHDSPATPESLMVNGAAMGLNPGGSVFETPEAAAKASPFTYIGKEDPPFLIFHGDKDTLVSPIASMALFEKLTEAGVEATRYVLPGASHGGPMFQQPAVIEKITEFYDKHLKA